MLSIESRVPLCSSHHLVVVHVGVLARSVLLEKGKRLVGIGQLRSTPRHSQLVFRPDGLGLEVGRGGNWTHWGAAYVDRAKGRQSAKLVHR